MQTILTSLSEQEFKNFLKETLREILHENASSPNENVPEILNISEAAALLKLKVTTLYEKTSRKLIPHFKKGNKLYFNRSELTEWVNAGRVKTFSEIEAGAVTHLLNRK